MSGTGEKRFAAWASKPETVSRVMTDIHEAADRGKP